MKLRVYADREHYSAAHRRELNDILKALWNDASTTERIATYGARARLFEVVEDPEAAHIHLLTMKWQYYVDQNLVGLALRAVEAARRARRPFVVFSLGDFEANFPVAGSDIHLFQASAYRSRHRTTNHGMPAFIDDPLAHRGGAELIRDKGIRPLVGFCGQAGATWGRHAARLLRNQARQLRWRVGLERWEPPPLEHTWFRQHVLDAFSASDAIECRFVLRTRYRAGVHSDDRNDPAERARREFLENVLGTDYTICMRGGGNFSIRFYEALAMGRIPAFVDTDCVLPFHDQIDWRDHVVWIDESRISEAGDIVARFHGRMSDEEFREKQRRLRRLWQDRLTPEGFYSHFHEHFPELQIYQ